MKPTRLISTVLAAGASAALLATPALAATPTPTADPDGFKSWPVCVFDLSAPGQKIADAPYVGLENFDRQRFADWLAPVGFEWGPGFFGWSKEQLYISTATDGTPKSLCATARAELVKRIESGNRWVCHYTLPDRKAVSAKEVPVSTMMGGYVMPASDQWVEKYIPTLGKPTMEQCQAIMTSTEKLPTPSKPTATPSKPADKPGRGVSAKTGADEQLPLVPLAVVGTALAGAVAARRRLA